MSAGSFFVELTDQVKTALVNAGHSIEQLFIGGIQQAVAKVKQLPIATKGLNIIQDLESSSLSGADRMNKLIADTKAELEQVQADGGIPGEITNLEDFGRELWQSLFNDFKAGVAKVVQGL